MFLVFLFPTFLFNKNSQGRKCVREKKVLTTANFALTIFEWNSQFWFTVQSFYIIFCLKVFDVGNESWVPEALFQNEYPSTEAHINVEVVLRPKIDVYPASTTLVKNQVIKDLE